MPYQPNEIADNDEPRMQVNDYNLYEANALPYKQGGVSLGVWRGGDPSQYVTFASDSLQPKTNDDRLFWQSSAEDNEKMNTNYPVYVAGSQVVTPLGLGTSSILAMNGSDPVRTTTAGIGIYDYDPVFEREVYEALRKDDCTRAIWEEAKGIFGDVLLEQILDIMMLSAPPPLRTPIYIYILLDGFCECVKTLREESVKKYKEEHHCSEEEARRNARYDKELLAEICKLFINEGLNHILKKWNWLPTDIQSILNSTIKSIADRIMACMAEQLV